VPGLSTPRLSLVVAAGLAGAALLARGRAQGLALIEASAEGALRSFWAMAFCLPAFLALRLLSWGELGEPSGGFGRALAAELIGFVVAWVGFALASRPLAEASGRLAQWPRFLAAWNWTNAVQYAVLLALSLPGLLGVPEAVGHALALAGLGYAVWLEWFATKSALQVTGARAAGFVGLDLALGLFLGGLVSRLSTG
jgi:hypothetical protein